MSTPEHIAIILDGNGRWAKSKGMPRNYGHTVGAKNVENICKAANDLGVKYLTLYAFSTENWNRPESEVAALMKLLESYLKNCIKTANKNNMRVRVIGEISRLSENFHIPGKQKEPFGLHDLAAVLGFKVPEHPVCPHRRLRFCRHGGGHAPVSWPDSRVFPSRRPFL